MRILNLTAVAATCFLAGNTHVQDDGPVFGVDDTHFRTDCDDWATTLPSGAEYWERTDGVALSMQDAIDLAHAYADEHYDFLEVRTLSAELRLTEKPFYRVELLSHHFNEKKNQDIYRRWDAHVGVVLKRVKTWLKLERYPGTPVVGDIQEVRPNGLQVHDVRLGDGKFVNADSTVRIHFTTTTLDGTLVFSTYQDRETQTFKVSEAPLEGMVEGLPGARKGGKRKLIIPPHLAFGDEGFGTSIPPKATVVYDIEILAVLD